MQSASHKIHYDRILIYYQQHLSRTYTFLQFANRAYIKGLDTLAFGEPGSKERRNYQYRLRDLKTKLNQDRLDPALTLPKDYNLEVRWCYMAVYHYWSSELIDCVNLLLCFAELHHHHVIF